MERVGADPEYEADPDAESNAMFVLAALLSNTLILNTKNAIDAETLYALDFVARMSETIGRSASTPEGGAGGAGGGGGGDGDDDVNVVAALAPRLVWLVRDFDLSLAELTSDDAYLEKALTVAPPKPGKQPSAVEITKETIARSFPDRTCVTLPKPCADTTHVHMKDASELDNDFVTKTRALAADIKARLAPKAVSSMGCAHGASASVALRPMGECMRCMAVVTRARVPRFARVCGH